MKCYEEDGDFNDIPLVKGGQGRTDDEVLEEAEMVLAGIALIAVLGVLVAIVSVVLAVIEKVA